MPSMQSTIVLATTLLGSLLQHAAAAPEASSKATDATFPPCITTCLRNSGCFDAQCVCDHATHGILSDIVICMNQWCTSDITAKDLIQPLSSQCDLPKSAVEDAEKKGGILVASGDVTSAVNPTSTSSPKSSGDGVSMTFDLGAPLTFPAETASTTKPVDSTLLVAPAATQTGSAANAGTTADSTETAGGNSQAAAATNTLATSTSAASAAGASATGASGPDDSHNGAGFTGQASIFGVVAAMAVTLALGF